MPPRYAYWTIIAGGLPTAFRIAEREELLPTFKGIQKKHPDAEMKYFARGRLWPSQEEARRAAAARRQSARDGTSRGRDWRPGGEHQDPRQKFKDAKKERNLRWRKERFERGQRSGAAPRPEQPRARPRPAQRPPRPEWRDRGPRTAKPAAPGDRPWRDRGPRAAKPAAPGDRPWRDREPRGNEPGAQRKPEARGDRPWRDRPPGDTRRGEPYRGKPKAGDDRKPVPPRPKGPYRPPASGGGPRPANRPAGSSDRGRNQRGPAKDRRRRS